MTKLATVMVVDDNPRCAEFLLLAFKASGGVAVMSETRPVLALDRIRTEKPDLVMMDIKMPELDGISMLSMLRGEGNPVPVIMCSGSALQKDVDNAYAQGCSGYVEKPSTLDDYRTMASVILDYWRRSEFPRH